MKTKLAALTTTASTYFILASNAFAQVNLSPGTPEQGIKPNTNPQFIITNAISIVFIIAILLVLFFLIWGAFDWITSGGDKEKVAQARKKIMAALIGLIILALAFVIARVAGGILNINFDKLVLPRLDKPVEVPQ